MKEAKERVSRIAAKSAADSLPSPSAVEAYLRTDPDFFRGREELLCELEIPHRTGAATSLVERQVALLRDRNIEMRHKLKSIVENARANDQLFQRTRATVLKLLVHRGKAELHDCVTEELRREFGADFVSLRFLADAEAQPTPPESLVKNTGFCGTLKAAERDFLFGDDGDAVESVAVVPISADTGIAGLLAVGSTDPAHFTRGTGTLFLEFIADVIARLR